MFVFTETHIENRLPMINFPFYFRDKTDSELERTRLDIKKFCDTYSDATLHISRVFEQYVKKNFYLGR